ncbi:MAG TPA: hypothetical protein VHQ41_03485 [Patescibacteria group bacterium]|jgi:hypothetical protein|nr:hypothetical protein [Patescibacteria group bacterium]
MSIQQDLVNVAIAQGSDGLLNLGRALQDAAFEEAPCKKCGNSVDWGFRFCIFCGTSNEDHFDPDYEVLDPEMLGCAQIHVDLLGANSSSLYCNVCGDRIY